jgi:hypothetical protein
MLEIEPTFYTPVVRWKQGEYLAHSALDPEIAKFVLPHIVLPPPKESDPERGRVLTNEELICVNTPPGLELIGLGDLACWTRGFSAPLWMHLRHRLGYPHCLMRWIESVVEPFP